jgi:hypothetical protein
VNDNWHTMPRKEGIAMRHYASAARTQTAEEESATNEFRRRLGIYLFQSMFNAILVARYAGTLYGPTTHDVLQ